MAISAITAWTVLRFCGTITSAAAWSALTVTVAAASAAAVALHGSGKWTAVRDGPPTDATTLTCDDVQTAVSLILASRSFLIFEP